MLYRFHLFVYSFVYDCLRLQIYVVFLGGVQNERNEGHSFCEVALLINAPQHDYNNKNNTFFLKVPFWHSRTLYN